METPDKKPKPRKKKTSLADNQDDNVDILIDAALNAHLIDYSKEKRKKTVDADNLSANVQEFLKNFIVLGYDYKGKPLTLLCADNQRDTDSLYTLIQKFMFQTMGPGADSENPFLK
jgi:hypothetical protein